MFLFGKQIKILNDFFLFYSFRVSYHFIFGPLQLRTLKAKMMRESTGPASYDAYGNVQQADVHTDYSIGRKRKLYFLLFISFAQPILSFWLSWHLIPSKSIEAAVTVQ